MITNKSTKKPSENIGFNGKTDWTLLTKKTTLPSWTKKPPWNTWPVIWQFNMAPVSSKNSTKQNDQKTFRSTQLEHCKPKTKNSSPQMLNFFVILTTQVIVTYAVQATRCRIKIVAESLQTKSTIMHDRPKTWVLTGKQFEDFGQIRNRNKILNLQQKTNGSQGHWKRPLNKTLVKSKN